MSEHSHQLGAFVVAFNECLRKQPSCNGAGLAQMLMVSYATHTQRVAVGMATHQDWAEDELAKANQCVADVCSLLQPHDRRSAAEFQCAMQELTGNLVRFQRSTLLTSTTIREQDSLDCGRFSRWLATYVEHTDSLCNTTSDMTMQWKCLACHIASAQLSDAQLLHSAVYATYSAHFVDCARKIGKQIDSMLDNKLVSVVTPVTASATLSRKFSLASLAVPATGDPIWSQEYAYPRGLHATLDDYKARQRESLTQLEVSLVDMMRVDADLTEAAIREIIAGENTVVIQDRWRDHSLNAGRLIYVRHARNLKDYAKRTEIVAKLNQFDELMEKYTGVVIDLARATFPKQEDATTAAQVRSLRTQAELSASAVVDFINTEVASRQGDEQTERVRIAFEKRLKDTIGLLQASRRFSQRKWDDVAKNQLSVAWKNLKMSAEECGRVLDEVFAVMKVDYALATDPAAQRAVYSGVLQLQGMLRSAAQFENLRVLSGAMINNKRGQDLDMFDVCAQQNVDTDSLVIRLHTMSTQTTMLTEAMKRDLEMATLGVAGDRWESDEWILMASALGRLNVRAERTVILLPNSFWAKRFSYSPKDFVQFKRRLTSSTSFAVQVFTPLTLGANISEHNKLAEAFAKQKAATCQFGGWAIRFDSTMGAQLIFWFPQYAYPRETWFNYLAPVMSIEVYSLVMLGGMKPTSPAVWVAKFDRFDQVELSQWRIYFDEGIKRAEVEPAMCRAWPGQPPDVNARPPLLPAFGAAPPPPIDFPPGPSWSLGLQLLQLSGLKDKRTGMMIADSPNHLLLLPHNMAALLPNAIAFEAEENQPYRTTRLSMDMLDFLRDKKNRAALQMWMSAHVVEWYPRSEPMNAETLLYAYSLASCADDPAWAVPLRTLGSPAISRMVNFTTSGQVDATGLEAEHSLRSAPFEEPHRAYCVGVENIRAQFGDPKKPGVVLLQGWAAPMGYLNDIMTKRASRLPPATDAAMATEQSLAPLAPITLPVLFSSQLGAGFAKASAPPGLVPASRSLPPSPGLVTSPHYSHLPPPPGLVHANGHCDHFPQQAIVISSEAMSIREYLSSQGELAGFLHNLEINEATPSDDKRWIVLVPTHKSMFQERHFITGKWVGEEYVIPLDTARDFSTDTLERSSEVEFSNGMNRRLLFGLVQTRLGGNIVLNIYMEQPASAHHLLRVGQVKLSSRKTPHHNIHRLRNGWVLVMDSDLTLNYTATGSPLPAAAVAAAPLKVAQEIVSVAPTFRDSITWMLKHQFDYQNTVFVMPDEELSARLYNRSLVMAARAFWTGFMLPGRRYAVLELVRLESGEPSLWDTVDPNVKLSFRRTDNNNVVITRYIFGEKQALQYVITDWTPVVDDAELPLVLSIHRVLTQAFGGTVIESAAVAGGPCCGANDDISNHPEWKQVACDQCRKIPRCPQQRKPSDDPCSIGQCEHCTHHGATSFCETCHRRCATVAHIELAYKLLLHSGVLHRCAELEQYYTIFLPTDQAILRACGKQTLEFMLSADGQQVTHDWMQRHCVFHETKPFQMHELRAMAARHVIMTAVDGGDLVLETAGPVLYVRRLNEQDVRAAGAQRVGDTPLATDPHGLVYVIGAVLTVPDVPVIVPTNNAKLF